jgi:DNA processing protein
MDRLSARALLARTPALGAEHVRALISTAGGDWVAALSAAALRAVPLAPTAREYLRTATAAAVAADIAWLEASGAQLLVAGDADYPPLLLATPEAPAALYVLGSIAALVAPQLAMVGARSATAGGRATAQEFARFFARAGLAVTSGLAVGIDAASHEGALQGGGLTIAVCGTGLDRVYPPEHARLARRIAAQGALLSEFPPGTPPLKANFPRRNRLISALSSGTLVVEAGRYSGALITARRAADYGREVFAIPGSIHSSLSRGCHGLIKQGAHLVENADDVLSQLKIPSPSARSEARTPRLDTAPELDKEYEMLLDALGFEPATMDALVARTELPGEAVASMLLILELQGRVATFPGGRYGRVP